MQKTLFFFLTIVWGYTIFAQSSEAYQWSNAAMGGGGFVSAVIASQQEQNLFYARTDVGGAYRWIESSQTWKPLNDWVSENEVGLLGIESLALDPQDPAKVYMLAGISYFNNGKTVVLKSDDYGDSFTMVDVSSQFKAHGNGMGRQTGERLAVDPNNSNILFCGTRRDGLFKSSNGGESWTNVLSFPYTTTDNDNGICIVQFDASSGTPGSATPKIYVGLSRMGENNLFVSEDGGGTWNAVGGQPTTYMPHRISLASDGDMYISYANGAGPHGHWSVPESMDAGGIWKYSTTSGTWTNVTPTGYTRAFGGICIDPQNPEKLVASTINTYMQQPWGWGDRIFVSEDGGASWTDMFAENKIAMDNNGIPWIDGHAIHWAGSVTIDPYNSDRVFITSGNGIFSTANLSNSVSTWKFMVDGIEETVPLDIVSIENGPIVSVIGDYDGSTYGNIYTFQTLHNPQIGTSTGVDYAKQNTNYVVRVGGDDDGNAFPLYYSNDMGDTWSPFASKPDGALLYKGGVAAAADGGAVVWGPENSFTLFRTANNGASWSEVTGVTMTNAYPVADGVNANKFYLYNNQSGAFYVSSDGGASFSQSASLSSGNYKKIRVVPGIEGDIWVPVGSGLYRSENSGTDFTQISTVNSCSAVGFGKAADGNTFPSIYIWGSAHGGSVGIYRSDDEGATWIKVNDDTHEFGGPANGQFVIGDMNVYGRVLMSTAGRGIVVGEPIGTTDCRVPELGDNKVICSATSVTIDSGIDEPEYSFQWRRNGELLDSTGISLTVSQTGTYSVTLTKEGCEDRIDNVMVTSDLFPILDDTVCVGSVANLSVNEAGNYNWYSSTESSDILYTGNLFQPTVEQTVTYYIEDAERQEYSIGLTEFNASDPDAWEINSGFDDAMYIMTLEITNTIKLDRISVHVTSAATNLNFRILASDGSVVSETTANGLGLGMQSVTVNTILEPDTYTLDAIGTTGGISLQVDNGAAEMGITDYATYTHQWGWHGIFFDLNFAVGNTCVRTPVTVNTENCTGIQSQRIDLSEGWNLISTYLMPNDNSVASVFAGIDIVQLKTDEGFYIPGEQLFLNSVQTIDPGVGYLVYSNSDQTMYVDGVFADINTMQVDSGWNLIGVFSSVEQSVDLFISTQGFVIVKDFDNFKDANDGQLTNILPGKAYFVKMSEPGVVTW